MWFFISFLIKKVQKMNFCESYFQSSNDLISAMIDFAHFWKLKHFLNSKVIGETVDVFVVGDSARCCECSQVGAALRPAFSADASPDVTAKACQVTIDTSLHSLYCSADPAVTEVQRGSAGGTVRYCWTGC